MNEPFELHRSHRGARLVLEDTGAIVCISPKGARIPVDGGSEIQLSIAAVLLGISAAHLQELRRVGALVRS